MAHTYEASLWQNASGIWCVNDVKDLGGTAGKWWVPARVLGISLTDYILLLKDKYNATIIEYYEPTDILQFYFEKEADARNYKNFINKIARNKKVTI